MELVALSDCAHVPVCAGCLWVVLLCCCVRTMGRRLGKTCSRHRPTRGAGSLFWGACHRDTHKRVIWPEIHAAEGGGITRATVLFFARRVARAPRGARADGAAPRFSRLAKTAETKGGRTQRVSWRKRGNERGRTLRAGKRRRRRSRAAEETQLLAPASRRAEYVPRLCLFSKKVKKEEWRWRRRRRSR